MKRAKIDKGAKIKYNKSGCLKACARGAKKTAYGYLWEYAEVSENA